MKARLKKYWMALVGALLIIALIAAYGIGYRISSDGIVRAGTLVIENLPDGTEIYLDTSTHLYPKEGTAHFLLVPGVHTIIVDAEGMQPWNELITIPNGGTLTVSPILVPVKVPTELLLGADRYTALSDVWRTTLPSQQKPLSLSCASVYVSGARIIAEATTTDACVPPPFLCESGTCAPTLIFEAREAITSLMALPGREDALVVASGGLLYVLELDPREPRFFAPLIKGDAPRAFAHEDNAITVVDGTDAFRITP